jgi:hypothetical protein
MTRIYHESMANEVSTLRGYDELKENRQEASNRVTVLWGK